MQQDAVRTRLAIPPASLRACSAKRRTAIDGYRLARHKFCAVGREVKRCGEQVVCGLVALDALHVQYLGLLRGRHRLALDLREGCARKQRIHRDKSEEHTSELQ